MTFSEVRQYQFGDDVRAIDWNVTARYNEPYIKVFEEERELTMLLMVDISGSESFGTKNQLKSEIVTEIAATMAFSATQNNDKIGLILFSDQIELYIPPKKGKSHVLRIIRELIEFQPKSKKTNISQALKFLSGVMKKKAIVFMISDFITDDNYEQTLKIVSKKHDVTGIRVYDIREEKMPNISKVPDMPKMPQFPNMSPDSFKTYNKQAQMIGGRVSQSQSEFLSPSVNRSQIIQQYGGKCHTKRHNKIRRRLTSHRR
jgi:uncharacterized protein (DUF58 family)